MLSVNFPKFLGTSFEKTPPDDYFLYLSVNFGKISRTPLGSYLFHVQVAEFQPLDTVKSNFTGTFQAFYARARSDHSKAFICLKSLKIICEEVNL